jgi:hypothetical protein
MNCNTPTQLQTQHYVPCSQFRSRCSPCRVKSC